MSSNRLERAHMVNARHLCLPYFILLGSAACASWQRTDEVTPIAKSVTIYSAGGSVISGVIDPATLGKRRLRLPATAAAINLDQDKQSLKWFTIQSIEVAKKEG